VTTVGRKGLNGFSNTASISSSARPYVIDVSAYEYCMKYLSATLFSVLHNFIPPALNK
jgi:hypothetical protein